MEVAMFDSISSHAFTGNKSLKYRLEAVKLQIVALRAVEQQIEQWISEEQDAVEADNVTLTKDQVAEITGIMVEQKLDRASVQSVKWAGLAVIKVMCGPDKPAVNEREYAKRAIDFMLSVGAINKTNVPDAERGRTVPAYDVCGFPLKD
jgi:hypothetical protein